MHTHYNRLIGLLIFCVLCPFSRLLSQSTTITLKPIQDNTLYQTSDGSLSNGAGDYIFCGKTAVGLIRRALIQFDLSAIPVGSKIESVTLTLQVSNAVGGARATTLHRVVRNWGEGSSDALAPGGMGTAAAAGDATWLHTSYSGELWYTPGGDFLPFASATTNIDNDGTYTWSSDLLKEDAQAWVNSSELNFGWIIIGDETTEKTAKRFDSREGNNAPTLAIRYSKPTTDSRLPAKVQFIHNAADPLIEKLHVLLNEQLIASGLPFRGATPFIDVPSNKNLTLIITSSRNVSGQRRAQVSLPIRFEAGKSYVLFINGVLSPNSFDNRVNQNIKINLYSLPNARTTSQGGKGYVDIVAFQGATDVPAIDVFMPQLQQNVVEKLDYTKLTDYVSLPALAGRIQMDVATTQQGTKIASYVGDLSIYAGQAITIFASGFLQPANNRSGLPFGLFIAQPNGKVVPIERLNMVAENRNDVLKDSIRVGVVLNSANEVITISSETWTEEQVQISWCDLHGRVLKVQGAVPFQQTIAIEVPCDLPKAQYWMIVRQKNKYFTKQVVLQ